MKYEFKVNEDKTECEIYLLRPYKYVGTVIKAPGGRSLTKRVAPNVRWLPINDALAAMGVISREEATKRALGY